MKGDNLLHLLVFTEYSQTNLERNQSPFCTKKGSGVKKVGHFCLGRKKAAKIKWFTKIIYVFLETQCFSASFWARIFSRKSDGGMPEFFSMVFFSGCFRPTFPSESWWLDLAPGDNFDAENPDSRHEAPHPEAPEDLLRYREHPPAKERKEEGGSGFQSSQTDCQEEERPVNTTKLASIVLKQEKSLEEKW